MSPMEAKLLIDTLNDIDLLAIEIEDDDLAEEMISKIDMAKDMIFNSFDGDEYDELMEYLEEDDDE